MISFPAKVPLTVPNPLEQQAEKRFINDQNDISPDKLVFLKAISNVIKSGMNIVGVDTPDKM